MRFISKYFFVPVVLSIAACQPSGFYDNHGNYHSSDSGYQGEKAVVTNATDDQDAVSYSFNQAGFYDARGVYAGDNNVFGVVTDFLPPAGLCRIWTPDKPVSMQDPATACQPKYHLRSSQYVVYGG